MKTQEWIQNNYTQGGPGVLYDELVEKRKDIIADYGTGYDRELLQAVQNALLVLRLDQDEIDDNIVDNLPWQFRPASWERLWQDAVIAQELRNPRPSSLRTGKRASNPYCLFF